MRSGLPTTAKITAVAILELLAAEERPCNASLIAMTSQCERTVRAALRTLESEGWLKVTPRYRANQRLRDAYRLRPPPPERVSPADVAT